MSPYPLPSDSPLTPPRTRLSRRSHPIKALAKYTERAYKVASARVLEEDWNQVRDDPTKSC